MPKKVNKERYFPFNEKGLMDYSDVEYPIVEQGRYYTPTEWKKYHEFTEDLVIDGYSRGRSSVKIDFKSLKDGKLYPMFISDFDDMIKQVSFINGIVRGKTYGFVKKGSNYGIYLVK